MIRNANHVDVPGIILLLQEGYARSHYAREKLGEIDVPEAKRLLVTAIHRHGNTNGGGCFVQVSEKDGAIEGLIVGTLSRVYGIGTRLMVTDLFWMASERVHPADPMKLMRNLIEWGRANPAVAEIRCGTTMAINDDPEQAGMILERLGMARYGSIYRMNAREAA